MTIAGRFLALFFLITFVTTCMSIGGCAKKEVQKDQVIATVNDEPILTGALKKQIAIRIRQNPSYQPKPDTLKQEIEVLINQKLLIQEAQARGLDRSTRFSETIKVFWEQTLIRELIVTKNAEFKNELVVSEEEVLKAYEQLAIGNEAMPDLENIRTNLKIQILSVKQSEAIKNWLEKVRSDAVVETGKYEKNLKPLIKK